MRAFRPSRFGALDEALFDDPVEVRARSLKLEVYTKRAEARQPLFEDAWNALTEREDTED